MLFTTNTQAFKALRGKCQDNEEYKNQNWMLPCFRLMHRPSSLFNMDNTLEQKLNREFQLSTVYWETMQSHSPTHTHNKSVVEWGSRTLRHVCNQAYPGSAMCVQKFDDSRGPAIRITYRISLRSSSLWEPRHPLLKVVHKFCINWEKEGMSKPIRLCVPILHLLLFFSSFVLFVGIVLNKRKRN